MVLRRIIPDDHDAGGSVGSGTTEAKEIIGGKSTGDSKNEQNLSSHIGRKKIGDGVGGGSERVGNVAVEVDDALYHLDSSSRLWICYDGAGGGAAAAAACCLL